MHIKMERKVLEKLSHPFLIKFYYAFQTKRRLNLILEYVQGGDLYSHLNKKGTIPEDDCKFYAAEILWALEYLHKNDLIFRGLKPEDVLIGADGHIKVTDFGLAKSKDSLTSTFWGSPLYLAPEIIKGERQSTSVDWWSFGVLMYEMMIGCPPFWSEDNELLLMQILENKFTLTDNISDHAKDLITALLKLDPEKRLGSGPEGVNEIKNHKFFEGIDWEKIQNK